MKLKKRNRCAWSESVNDLYIDYHDTEWGVPVWDDQKQFEFLILEGAQAGLSWSTVLNKREAYRRRLLISTLSRWRVSISGRLSRLSKIQASSAIVSKIGSAVNNAKSVSWRCRKSLASFRRYIWRFVGGRPIQNRFETMKDIPATSEESDALSKDLKKRGFKFVGSTIMYAHMQAVGMVNDHVISCFRYREVKAKAHRK